MNKKIQRVAYFPKNTTVIEDAAAKVITRIVSDGTSLRDAVREVIRLANFNQQEVFGLLCMLQNYGQIGQGDFKNYWSAGWGQGAGEAGMDTNMGTNYFASNNKKVVTASSDDHFVLFAEINKLRSLGMTTAEIKEMNPELGYAIDVMEETDAVVASISSEIVKTAGENFDAGLFERILRQVKPIWENMKASGKTNASFEDIFHQVSGGRFPNINWHQIAPFVRRFIPDYEPLASVEPKGMGVGASSSSNTVTAQVPVPEGVPAAAPEVPGKEDISVEEDAPDMGNIENIGAGNDLATEAPMEQSTGGSVSAEVTPSPEELEEMAQQGPEWKIENLLSLEKALNYYEELSEQLETVVFNPNLKLSMEDVAKYDTIRNSIDAEINKINEAQKGKEKLEKKEDALEEEVNQPTEEISVEEPMEEPAPEVPGMSAPTKELEVTE